MRKKLSRIISFILAILVLSTLFIINVRAADVSFSPGFDIKSDYVYLVNLDTNMPVFQKNAHEKCYPASTTKIMTYIIVTEKVKDLEKTMVTIKKSVLNLLEGTGSSISGISEYVDKKISVLELLYCMMVPSGNDAALVLADYIGGGNISEFSKLMNQKAKELGCENTHFVNPHGLHDKDHYTTAYDMYKITEYAITTPYFTKIVNTATYDLHIDKGRDPIHLVTTNDMISKNVKEYYYENARGIKTGTTDEAGRCLVSTAVKDGMAYMCVAMHAPCNDSDGNAAKSNGAMLDSKALYEWVFKDMSIQKVVSEQAPVHEIKINYAMEKDTLFLVPEYAYSAILPNDIDKNDIVINTDAPEVIDAPVTKGTTLGTATVTYKGQELTRFNLVAGETVKRSGIVYAMVIIKNVVTSPIFIIALAFVLVLLISYIIFVMRLNKNKVNKP